MAYTLGDAARATGKSKPTIAKAIKAGRISATKTEDGSYQIDPSELHRVYPMAVKEGATLYRTTPRLPSRRLQVNSSCRALRQPNIGKRFATCAQGSTARRRSGGS
jgi:excisionase family DNA binding protein